MKRYLSMVVALACVGYVAAGCGGADEGAAGGGESPAAQDAQGWVTLLDGATGLEGWDRVGDANWREVDGVVQADAKTGTPAGFLVSPRPYSDFELHVEFWVSDDANSGIYMRCADPRKMSDVTCYEANIFDQRPDPDYGTGAIVHHSPIDPMPKAGGKWNTLDITADGPRLTVLLNGEQTASASDTTLSSGPIALQYAAGVVKFRNVRVRELR
ncbi:MAG: 3-keto-disaccharide hydrolase [Gemmatimonadaceae bacterium]